MRINFADKIVHASYCSWMFTLFTEIGVRNPALSFTQRKDAFLVLIAELLAQGKIKFIAPGADCYVSPATRRPRLTIHDPEAHWKASPQEIVAHLRTMWPDAGAEEGDEALLIYFYQIPGVIWVDASGAYVSGG
jgi:hypothetical protein